jgi:hypothetical protein
MRFHEYNRRRGDVIRRALKKAGYLHYIRKIHDFNVKKELDKAFIVCPWCNEKIRYKDKGHAKRHYIKA